jgi:3-methyladenine DNA glycosylase AlkD
MTPPSPTALADEIAERLRALSPTSVTAARAVRREFSRTLRTWADADVLAVALALVDRHRWVAFELVYHHPTALGSLDATAVERLGRGFNGWGDVDAFARYISGPAWRLGAIEDELIEHWCSSADRWWRRAALVSTVPLNLRSAGGTGDTRRTLATCARLVDDRDDMVVKALSWALRELVRWDAGAVRTFLQAHDTRVAARVRREVTNKLETGLKQPTAG